MWAKWEDLQQRYYIKVSFQIHDHISREVFPLLVKYLKEKLNGSAFVFINFCSEFGKCEEAIEAMLIAVNLEIDTVTIHGKMEKHDKFGFITLFMEALILDKYFPNVCILMAAANTGINKATIEMVIWMGIPRDVVTSF